MDENISSSDNERLASWAGREIGGVIGGVLGILIAAVLFGFVTTLFPIEKKLDPFDSTAEKSAVIAITQSGYITMFIKKK